MKIEQFGEACSAQLNATSKVSKAKVGLVDFVRFAKTCAEINACDKRATKVTLNGESFNFDELEVPVCLKQMIYPCVLTPNGDVDSEADFLTHDFGSIITFDSNKLTFKKKVNKEEKEVVVDIEPFDGYELARFCAALYGSWKADVEAVKVSDLRVAAPMNAEVIKLTCNGDEVSAAAERNFPIATKVTLISDEVTTESVDTVVKKWIVKTLTK